MSKNAEATLEEEEIDYSLNDVALRGWVTTTATER